MAHEDKNPVFSERVREQLLLRRILVLDGVLDDDNGTLLATELLTLAAEDPATDVALWINSPGGSVPSMLAIRDVMRLVPCDVATLALGLIITGASRGSRSPCPYSGSWLAARPGYAGSSTSRTHQAEGAGFTSASSLRW